MVQIRYTATLTLLTFMIALVGCDSTEGENTASTDGPVANEEPWCGPEGDECPGGGGGGGGGGNPTGLYVGHTGCTWGDDDCNMCVQNVPTKFQQIRDHGEVLGFRRNGYDLNVSFPLGGHLQGIQRLRSGNGRYFVVTKSGSSETSFVVQMGSRNTSGARFRSNRLSTTIDEPEDTPPPTSDRVVRLNPTPYSAHDHGGGTQALGNVFAMASEGGGYGRVYLYDYRSPTNPQIIDYVQGETSEAGAAGLTKLSDGRFLLALGRGDSDQIEFWRSDGTDIFSNMGWSSLGVWDASMVNGTVWASYQALNFITDCSGTLYMVGMYASGYPGNYGYDYVDLYRLANTSGSNLPTITQVVGGHKHMYCSNAGDRMCNFDAGSGVYITPERQLLIYAVEHEDSGPAGAVNMVEFRSIYPNANCGSQINQAFVDYYDDSDYSDRGFIVDYVDRALKNEKSFYNFDRFNDKASAVRYCIPQGWRVRVYEDSNYGDSYRDLIGTGGHASYNLNNNGFNDKASSMRWLHF